MITISILSCISVLKICFFCRHNSSYGWLATIMTNCLWEAENITTSDNINQLIALTGITISNLCCISILKSCLVFFCRHKSSYGWLATIMLKGLWEAENITTNDNINRLIALTVIAISRLRCISVLKSCLFLFFCLLGLK